MSEQKRVDAIVHATMLTSTQFWRNEYDKMQRERDQWKQVADMFAVAEASFERIMAFKAWEELTSRIIPKEIENK